MGNCRKVTVQGFQGWMFKDDTSSGPIIPPHQVDENGDLCSMDGRGSYAHVIDGTVMRYGTALCPASDIVEGWATEAAVS